MVEWEIETTVMKNSLAYKGYFTFTGSETVLLHIEVF